MRQTVNYIWVGNSVKSEQLGHDLIGPVSMIPRIDHDNTKLVFWCLAEHGPYYEKKLQNLQITVRPIEGFVREQSRTRDSELKKLADDVGTLLEKILETEGRGTVRDFVTAKEAFAFLLLAAEGGYVLDTNVIPTAKQIVFPSHPNFRIPAFKYPVETYRDADVWMMYSPLNNSDHVRRALHYFLREINQIEKEIPEKNSDQYKASVLHVVIQAALQLDESLRDSAFWISTRLGSNFPVKVFMDNGEFSIEKRYYNSHGAQDRGVISPLMRAIALNEVTTVEKLLQTGVAVNAITETEYCKNVTPLSVAVFYGRTTIATLLLQSGANPAIRLESRLTAVPSALFRTPSSPSSVPSTRSPSPIEMTR